MEHMHNLSKRVVSITLAVSAVLLGGCTIAGSGHVEALGTTAPATTHHLIFASNRTGNYDIYDKNLQTQKLTDLTPTTGDDMNPQPSADNRYLVFYSDRSGTNQIYRHNLQNPAHAVTRLTHDEAQDYDPTFIGNRILFKSNKDNADTGNGNIWIMNGDGTDAHDLTSSMSATEQYKPTVIDNMHISFTTRFTPEHPSSDELFTEDLTTRMITQVTHNSVPDWFSSVYPGTGRMVFVSREPGSSFDSIYTAAPDASDRQQLVGSQQLQSDNDDPSWSPDGTQVVFVNDDSGDYTIYEVATATKAIKELDHGPRGDDLAPILIDY